MLLLVSISLLVFLPVNLCSQVKTAKFVKEQLQCSLAERISHGCSEEVTTPTAGLLHCVSLCGQKEDCIGASLDGHGKCLHHQICDIGPCQVEDPARYYYVSFDNYCVHGTWDPDSRSCSCVTGALGARCNVFAKNCHDLYNAGSTLDGSMTATINPSQDGETLYSVLCDMAASEVKTFLVKSEGKLYLFNRTWEEYASGFKMDDNNFWAGLRLWHELTKEAGMRVVIKVTFNAYYTRTFEGFRIMSENTKFQYTYVSSQDYGTKYQFLYGPHFLGSCLKQKMDAEFSTWDDDNDEADSENCAARAGVGWWYNDVICDNPCNLLGLNYEFWDGNPQYQRFSMGGLDMDVLGQYLSSLPLQIYVLDKN